MSEVDPRDTETHVWCAFHEELEERGEFTCGECWHQFRDEDDVVETNNRNWDENRTFDEIFCCPYCVHDF